MTELSITTRNPELTTQPEKDSSSPEWQDVFMEGLAMADGYLQEGQERQVKAVLASLLEDAYYQFRSDGKGAVELGYEIQDMLEESTIPSSIDRADASIQLPGKRQPTLEEGIAATLERYDFMERLEHTFGGKVEGIIVGGSMSYGPFLNVRSGEDNSDVDAIMVMGEDFSNGDGWESFANSNIISERDKETFLRRKDVFLKEEAEGNVDILSQRFTARSGSFNMSAHIIPKSVFESICSTGLAEDLGRNDNTVVTLRDYKSNRFERPKCDHLSLSGKSLDYSVPQQKEVQDGFVAEIPAYIIQEGEYYPGLYQCLLLPTTLTAYDSEGFTSKVAADFTNIVTERVEEEKVVNPDSSLLNAHPRKAILAPGRYE